MSSVIKGIFGGSDDSAQRAQTDANRAAQRFIEEQSKLARKDAERLFPQAQANLLTGNRAAFDLLKQVLPIQQRSTQLARGSILGNRAAAEAAPPPVNPLSGVEFPEFQTTQAPQQPQLPQYPFNWGQFLAGRF